jgi:type III secretion protein Q
MSFPFDLPRVSRGHAELTRKARKMGHALAEAIGRTLSELLREEVRITGRARPAAPAEGVGVVVLHFELAALPGHAQLEVEPSLVARVVERLAGGDGRLATTALGPLERAGLDLLALAALDGVAAVTLMDEVLGACLVAWSPRHPSPLAVDLELAVGPVRGRARLLLPPGAVRALACEAPIDLPDDVAVLMSLRHGGVRLTPAELSALEPGDVLRVEPGDGRHSLQMGEGFTAWGRLDGSSFQIEEVVMPEPLTEIPLLLQVELAKLPVTLNDLQGFTAGATLPLALDRSGLVTLRLGERPIARGQLVDVDGAVGVQLLALERMP